MQTSKINWLKLGDGNNVHFHAIARGKTKKTGLYKLTGKEGQQIIGETNIELEVLHLYEELIGQTTSKLKHVDNIALRQGPQLQEHDINFLI